MNALDQMERHGDDARKEEVMSSAQTMGALMGEVMADVAVTRSMAKLICEKLGISKSEIARTVVQDMSPSQAEAMARFLKEKT